MEKITVFSCFRTVLCAIQLLFPDKIGNRPLFTISGNDDIKTRASIIKAFGKSENGVLLLTYDIGSTGLNLQCSNTVLLVDFWWNSGKTEQAIARILRFGQKSEIVNIYYFTANTGMEKSLFKLQHSKLEVAKELLVGGCKLSIPKISTADIIRIIQNEENVTELNKVIYYKTKPII